jgi:hypothetical protein
MQNKTKQSAQDIAHHQLVRYKPKVSNHFLQTFECQMFKRNLFVLAFVFAVGCQAGELPKAETPPDSPNQSVLSNTEGKPDVSEGAPKLDHQAFLFKLFSNSWFASYERTKSINLDSDPEGSFAWFNCTQRPVEVFFVDEGMKWKVKTRELKIVPVDFDSPDFKNDFKLLDDSHLAVRVDKNWLVFSSSP